LPNTVLECLGARVPFLASFVGGIPEMIHEDDWVSACFSPRPRALAGALACTLTQGAAVAKPALSADKNEQAWLGWHENLLKEAVDDSEVLRISFGPASPQVTVCMAHRNRHEYLRQALTSLEAQTYKNLEVIVVDDASDHPETLAALLQLEPRLAQRGWRLLRLRENSFPGAARNYAARAARGEYLLFMDDDNFAKPNEVSVLVEVARRTRADIVACFRDVFQGSGPPDAAGKATARWLFLGAAATLGIFDNCFGDTNALVRREKFLDLGGFHERWGIGNEDWEFMAQAVLKGCRLEVVPEALVWYRLNPEEPTVNRTTPPLLNALEALQPFQAALPPSLGELPLVARGLELRNREFTAQLQACWTEVSKKNETLSEYGLLASGEPHAPGWIKQTLFRALGWKMRRSIRKRLTSLSRWLLDPA
jgi:hypothetical protein